MKEGLSNATDIKRIVREYYELYDNKLDNLEEIVKFLGTHSPQSES